MNADSPDEDPLSGHHLQARFTERVDDLARASRTAFHREAVDALLGSAEVSAPPGAVLDLGCGTGSLLARWRTRRAVGLDLTPAMCARARMDTGCPVVVGDAHRLPFSSQTFAVVTGLFHFQLIRSPGRALAEVRRVLVPGGHHAIVLQAPEWTPESAARDARAAGLDAGDTDALVRCATRPTGTHRYTDAELQRFFEEARFESVRVERIAGGRLQRVLARAAGGHYLGGL